MLAGSDDGLRNLFKSAELSGFKIFEAENVKGLNPVTDVYYEYWSSKCQQDRIPARQDIRPEELRQHLPHAVLMDILEESGPYQDFRLKVRLIGTHVAAAFGEITGQDIADMTNTAAARRIYRMATLAREKRTPVLSHVRGYAPGREHMEAFALYMPLSETGEVVDRIFVAVDVRLAEGYG